MIKVGITFDPCYFYVKVLNRQIGLKLRLEFFKKK